MNAKKFIAAAAVFVATGSAFAADAPVAANAAVIASTASLPTVSISRAEVRAEAIESVKNHKTAFAVQLEQYKN